MKHQPPPTQIHPTAVIDQPSTIGSGTKIWHFSHILAGAEVGEDCVIGQNCSIAATAIIGSGSKLQNNVSVFDGVRLEANVFCGPSCVFTNVLTPRADINRSSAYLPTIVEEGATIGANSTILCGVRIGRRAMIGAGSVVTKDVPPHALFAGNPARRIGWVCTCGSSLRGQKNCPDCNRPHPISIHEQPTEAAL